MHSLSAMASLGLVAVLLLMTVTWLLSVLRRNASLVDRVWGLAFVLQVWLYGWASAPLDWRQWLVLTLVTIWGLRLSVHLYLESRGKPEDARYAAMRAASGELFWLSSYRRVFLLQGGLAFLIAAPLLATMGAHDSKAVTVFDVIGLLLWSVGFFFDVVGDRTLKTLRLDKTGLAAPEHADYLGDALIWWGFYAFAVSVPGGWLTFFGPALMLPWLKRRERGESP